MNKQKESEQKSQKRSKVAGLRHKASHDPRVAALSALYSVLYEGIDSQAALDGALRSADLVPTDRRLCTELLYGVLRWYLRLDSLVCARLKNPGKLPVEMRLALLVALYELSALRIPAHATVNWAVQHVRSRFGAGLAGVANGVLRALQRERPQLFPAECMPDAMELSSISSQTACSAPVADNLVPDDAQLAAQYSMPKWIVHMWRQQYGLENGQQLLAASQKPAPVGVRLNMARHGWDALLHEVLSFAPDLMETPHSDNPGSGLPPVASSGKGKSSVTSYRIGDCTLAFSGSLPWMLREPVKNGRASRQSAASYEALFSCEPKTWPGPVWDVCAGRGGKSLALMEAGIPVALASDPSAKRLLSLPEEYSRLFQDADMPMPALCAAPAEEVAAMLETGATCDHVLSISDGVDRQVSVPSSLPKEFGTILVDAPCSGLGTLARRPEIRLRRTLEDCDALVLLQRTILDAVWPRLQSGGVLVYLTCTMNMAENEAQVQSFLGRHTDASMEAEFVTAPNSPLGEFFYCAKILKA